MKRKHTQRHDRGHYIDQPKRHALVIFRKSLKITIEILSTLIPLVGKSMTSEWMQRGVLQSLSQPKRTPAGLPASQEVAWSILADSAWWFGSRKHPTFEMEEKPALTTNILRGSGYLVTKCVMLAADWHQKWRLFGKVGNVTSKDRGWKGHGLNYLVDNLDDFSPT